MLDDAAAATAAVCIALAFGTELAQE